MTVDSILVRRTKVSRAHLATLYWYLAMLVGVGFVTIGASGAIGWAMSLAWGKDFIAGNDPGTVITPARCDEYFEYAHGARDCLSAAVQHHFAEFLTYNGAAAVLGALVLASHWLLRRRFAGTAPAREQSLRVHALLGTGAFALATAVLAPLGAMTTLHSRSTGGGSYVAAALASGAAFVVYAALALRVHAVDFTD